MIKIENVSTVGWEAAIRGARNPMNSWEKSDSLFYDYYDDITDETVYHTISDEAKLQRMDAWNNDISWTELGLKIGPNDLKLLTNLAKAGSDEAKFRRMIVVYVDITAPMYWWKEADTYKVGTVRNSCSTMHKIHAKEFTLDDFSWEQLLNNGCDLFKHEFDKGKFTTQIQPLQLLTDFIIPSLNACRELYLKTKDKKYWWQMIQLLPSSYNQRATLMLNYEVLANMYHARKNHKLDEWREFCKWIETLPYAKELIIGFQMRTDIYEPTVLSKDLITVNVCEEKDGVIELRRGVPALYLGDGVDWAQVRIQVDQDHYIKGMAVYADDISEDNDIIVNVRDENEAFKELDYKCAFSKYSHHKLKQRFYKDPSTGEFKLSPINIIDNDLDWDQWNRTLVVCSGKTV